MAGDSVSIFIIFMLYLFPFIYMEKADTLKSDAIEMLERAWQLREKEISEEYSQLYNDLSSQLTSLNQQLESATQRISDLEEENSELATNLDSMQQTKVRLEVFKNKLLATLRETDETYLPESLNSPRSPYSPSQSPNSLMNNSYVDGKKFFAEARERLSFSNFNTFLSYIRKLNQNSISKEKVILEVKEIFGNQNQDLYRDFIWLLNKKQYS